jgi:hypothetical protein
VAEFIAAQRVEYAIPQATACRALGVSPAWFYKWMHGDASPRRARRAQLAVAIKQLFAAHRGPSPLGLGQSGVVVQQDGLGLCDEVDRGERAGQPGSVDREPAGWHSAQAGVFAGADGSSTRAWARCRASSQACCPAGVSVAKQV